MFERFGLRLGVSTLDDVRRTITAVGATTLRELNPVPSRKSPGPRLIETDGSAGYGMKDAESVSFMFDEQLNFNALIVHRNSMRVRLQDSLR